MTQDNPLMLIVIIQATGKWGNEWNIACGRSDWQFDLGKKSKKAITYNL
jgi:hypothetical protein